MTNEPSPAPVERARCVFVYSNGDVCDLEADDCMHDVEMAMPGSSVHEFAPTPAPVEAAEEGPE